LEQFWSKCAQSIVEVVNQVRRLGDNGKVESTLLKKLYFLKKFDRNSPAIFNPPKIHT